MTDSLAWWSMTALTALLGLCVGSFLNVVIYRVPQKLSLLRPGSHCPDCNTPLKPLDLIPVVSWLALRGKCRACGKAISPRYMVVELLTGVLFTLCWLQLGFSAALPAALALAGVLVATAFIDAEHSIIPNGLVLFGAIVGAASCLLTGHPGIKDALLGALWGGGPLFVIDVLTRLTLGKEGMGGGDVKLMAMAGLFLGWKGALIALFLGVVLGGITGAILLATKKVQRGGYFPFGPFLSAGVFLSLLYANRIVELYLAFNQSIINRIVSGS